MKLTLLDVWDGILALDVAVVREAELAGGLAGTGLSKCEANAGEVDGDGV